MPILLKVSWAWNRVIKFVARDQVDIQLQVSNLNSFKLDTCNWAPMQFTRKSATLEGFLLFSYCVCNPLNMHLTFNTRGFQSLFNLKICYRMDTINW